MCWVVWMMRSSGGSCIGTGTKTKDESFRNHAICFLAYRLVAVQKSAIYSSNVCSDDIKKSIVWRYPMARATCPSKGIFFCNNRVVSVNNPRKIMEWHRSSISCICCNRSSGHKKKHRKSMSKLLSGHCCNNPLVRSPLKNASVEDVEVNDISKMRRKRYQSCPHNCCIRSIMTCGWFCFSMNSIAPSQSLASW